MGMLWFKRLFKNNNRPITVSKLTHEVFPEALHWQIGDTIQDNYNFNKKWKLRQINNDCTFFAEEQYSYPEKPILKKFKFNRDRFINYSYNRRYMENEIKMSSKQYQELIDAFQISFKELNKQS